MALTLKEARSYKKDFGLFKKHCEDNGWTFEEYRMYKKVGRREIDIEFCIGDYCLGIYDEEYSLIEPKDRCKTLLEAYVKSVVLEDKYTP